MIYKKLNYKLCDTKNEAGIEFIGSVKLNSQCEFHRNFDLYIDCFYNEDEKKDDHRFYAKYGNSDVDFHYYETIECIFEGMKMTHKSYHGMIDNKPHCFEELNHFGEPELCFLLLQRVLQWDNSNQCNISYEIKKKMNSLIFVD